MLYITMFCVHFTSYSRTKNSEFLISCRAFKSGINTLCQGEEKAKLVGFICTLLENLLHAGQVEEVKQWVEYLQLVEHPEVEEFKDR